MALRRLALPRHSVQIDKHLSDSPKKSQNHAVFTESDLTISGTVFPTDKRTDACSRPSCTYTQITLKF